MYLSKIVIASSDCYKYKLFDDYTMHQFIKSLFPFSNQRYLYYVDRSVSGILAVLIQSLESPEDSPVGLIKVKEIPESFYNKEVYRFRIRVSPVRQHQGKAIVLLNEDDQIRWFCEKSSNYGFEVDLNTISIVCNGIIKTHKKGDIITIHYIDFVGQLKVQDKNKFLDSAVKGGIGRSKAFGCGLLQLQPTKE